MERQIHLLESPIPSRWELQTLTAERQSIPTSLWLLPAASQAGRCFFGKLAVAYETRFSLAQAASCLCSRPRARLPWPPAPSTQSQTPSPARRGASLLFSYEIPTIAQKPIAAGAELK